MKNSKSLKILISIILVFVMGLGILVAASPNPSTERTNSFETASAFSANYWNSDDIYSDGIRIDNLLLNGTQVSGAFDFQKSDVLTVVLPSVISANYHIGFKYHSENARTVDTVFELTYNGQKISSLAELIWRDADGAYRTDRYGNEIAKEQVNANYSFFAPLRDNRSVNSDPVLLNILPDCGDITIENMTQSITVEEVWLYSQQGYQLYQEYISEFANAKAEEGSMITVQGEDYSLKSDSEIRSGNVNSPGIQPYNTYKRLINVLEGSSWSKAGEKVIWEFDVEKEGWYEIGFKYCQNSATGKKSYRLLQLDGKVPFEELTSIPFKQTSNRKFITEFLQDENSKNYMFYLTEGKHTVSLLSTVEPVIDVYNELKQLVEEMNEFGSDITKLTAGRTDSNRTWDIEIYLPNAVSDLKGFAERINKIYDALCEIEGENATYADDLIYARDLIETLLSSPRTIPNRMDMFNTGDSSAIKYISNVISSITDTTLSIDEIYINPTGNDFEVDKVSVGTKLLNSVKRLAYSLTGQASESAYSDGGNKESLKVWMSRSSVYVQVLQSLVDSDKLFKDDTVDISIMPSEQKLVLAAASGTNPDVVLGVSYATPYKFALRGAAKDLTEYSDFIKFYNEEYDIENLVPCCYNNGVYGAIETKDFDVLFYRKDILEDLGIGVPDTWEDVKRIMPTLLRYNKNISIPISNAVTYKNFNTTSPFIYQNGGEYYSESGISADFLSKETFTGFTEMTELFKIYAMDEYVASFYSSFRNGDCPLGVGGVSVYVQLSEAAPELAGLWNIAPAPGNKLSDGSVVRYNGYDSTACMIFDNTDKSELSWRFLKWWLSGETQKRFASTMESSYGTQYRWNTANVSAFAESNYSEEHKEVIRTMWDNQKETLQHPAGYIVEREISNAFNNVVVDGMSVIEALEKATLVSNREIERKLKEFGYYDDDGNLIEEYPTRVLETLQQQLKESEEKTNAQ